MSKLAKAIQAAAGNAGGDKLYVEDVFSTYLYTGNGSTQTINNGIDLDGEGGLVWIKNRIGTNFHLLMDTERGGGNILNTNTTGAETVTTAISFNTNGFNLLNNNGTRNRLDEPYASWTFRKAPKFFDVVTYTGDGVAGRTVAHNLESVPGMMVVKLLSGGDHWNVWHGAIPSSYIQLNSISPANSAGAYRWGNNTVAISPTSTNFTVSSDSGMNGSGKTYVAYLFANDTSDDGFIQCGNYSGNNGTRTITLGWRPQFVLIKNSSKTPSYGDTYWTMFDDKRSNLSAGVTSDRWLSPDRSNSESFNTVIQTTATGFEMSTSTETFNQSGSSYIYMAIKAED